MARKPEAANGKSKTEVVRELIERGITAPVEISQAAEKEFGLVVTPSYASIIKSGLKKKKGKRTAVRGRRVRAHAVATVASTPDLSLENLALRFALKAGSVDTAIAALEKLR